MKKILSVCAVLSVCSLMLLTACGDKAKPTPDAPLPETRTIPKTEPSPIPSSVPDSHLHPINVNGIRLNFIDLPAVREEEVVQLQQALNGLRYRDERTFIVAMPAFRAAEAKTSIGLYRAVMGAYPDAVGCNCFEWGGRECTPRDAQIKYADWDANPDLPLVCTTSAQDMVFAQRLSQITGRRFRIMTDSQNEYSIRGRVMNEDGSWGAITTTGFHFGDDEDQVRNRAFIDRNPLTQNHAHGVHEIPDGQDALYRNSFGLIHPIGNVHTRSIEGTLRGGAFEFPSWSAESSDRLQSLRGYGSFRRDDVGSRLYEEIR